MRFTLWVTAALLCFTATISVQMILNVDLNTITLPLPRSTKYMAASASSAIGTSVSKAGDVNGDGQNDFIIGGPTAEIQGGVAFVLFGNAALTTDVDLSTFASGTTGFKITNAGISKLGFSVSGGGDFNNDGYDDVVVGAPYASPQSRNGAGQVFVIFGHSHTTPFSDVSLATLVAGSGGFTIMGSASNNMLGCSVAFAGDFNKDGADDIVIGTQSEVAYVILGHNTNLPISTDIDLYGYVFGPTTGLLLSGNGGTSEYFGRSVGGAGDVNGDGTADLIVGASRTTVGTNTNCGVSYVIFGSSGITGTPVTANSFQSGSTFGFKIIGAQGNDQSGAAISSAGDVNGDGIADILVGAPNANVVVNSALTVNAGITYVIFGRSYIHGGASYQDINLVQFATTGSSLGFAIMGASADAMSGSSVSGAGDVNRDGLNDIIVGAVGGSATVGGNIRSSAGISYVIYGRNISTGAASYSNVELLPLSTGASAKGFAILGAASGDKSGFSVSAAGDLNGDGSSDLLVGAPYADPVVGTVTRSDGGIVYVVYGAFPDPTSFPTARPSAPTFRPTFLPSMAPTPKPTTAMPSTPFPSTPPSTSQPTSQPTAQPTRQPSAQPSRQPSSQPTRQPSTQPSRQPSGQPSRQPTVSPSGQPVSKPSAQPVGQPSKKPTGQPSGQPVSQPSGQPSGKPSAAPSNRPTSEPSKQPSSRPTGRPTSQPVSQPSRQPTVVPSAKPSGQPTSRPSLQATGYPTSRPTAQPTSRPSARPSAQPTSRPSAQPTGQPTSVPTARPTLKPTSEPSSVPEPSAVPSAQPTSAPTSEPTGQPTSAPTSQPLAQPTSLPTARPMSMPSDQPTSAPTSEPSGQPTSAPSAHPTSMPTARPSAAPTVEAAPIAPSRQPSVASTSAPTVLPSVDPSRAPLVQPSTLPTVTAAPTPIPTMKPSFTPSRVPSLAPSRKPSAGPTAVPSVVPSVVPTVVPGQTQIPSRVPTAAPSLSLEAVWRAELAAVLATAPVDGFVAVVHRSTYYELDVSTAMPSTSVYGSCSAWRSLLNGDIATSKALYKPIAVELVHQYELSQVVVASRCDDAGTASAVLTALTDTTSAAGRIQSFSCGEDTWVVSTCAASSVPAMCVGCDDPCAAANHCSSGEGSIAQSSISPCVTASCSAGSSLVSGLRLLRLSYAESVPAPSFLSRSVVSTTTSLTVTAVLSAPGSVYCAAYLLDPQSDVIPAPTSVGSLILQNFVGATDATNTSVVTILGLQSATDFMVYCMSVSRTGSVQSLDDVLAQPLTPSTTCCIPVVVQTSSVALRESQASNSFLTMTVNARPSVDMEVSVAVVNSTGGTVLPVPLFPASFRLNALSAATATFGLQSSTVSTSAQMRIQTATMTSSLLALPVGNYTYEVTISGASASQYAVVYTQAARSITVLPGSAALPAPVLTSAVFSDDGSQVVIFFDSNSDKGGFATQFTCGALFSFACASTSTCVWASNKQVKAYVNGDVGCVAVGSIITLSSSGVLRARCPSCAASDAASWPTSSVTSVVAAAPSSGVTPSVVISAPSTVGACDTLTLDISGSSGNGGRPWPSPSIEVETTATANLTDLRYFLTHTYQASPPTAIPAALLSKGHSYNFVVTLCNFLGKCSQASKRVLAVDRTVPTVLLPGGSLRTTTRSAALSISSAAYTLQCNGGSAVRSGLTYAWTVSNGGAVLLNMVSTSKDPSKFVLPPYSLQVGTTYDVTLTATLTATAQSASATVQVNVQQGNIRAVFAGGTSQTVRAGEILLLDVSGSYDEDQAGKTGLGAGLVATWSCAQVQPNYENSCAVVAHAFGGSSDDGKMTFFLVTKASAQDSVVQVSLFLLDETRTRSAETVITVTIVAPLSPSVALTSNVASTGVLNSNRELQLTATVSLPASFNGTAVWSVDDTSNFDFAAAVMSPLSVYLAPMADGAISTVYLVLAANTLPGRSTLTFSLTAMVPQRGLSSVGSVVVTVNAPPQAGTFVVTPVNGVEIVDQFTFLADRWFDADLPLLYQFAYVSVSGGEVTVRSKLEVAHASTTLLAGLAVRNFSVSCVAQVFDSLAASTITTVTVQVFKEPARSAASLTALITASLGDAASSVDGLKQATALGSYLLNDVDCSAAPNCEALHRDECFRTTNTCGECLSTAYVGDAGDSNHACAETGADFNPESAFQFCDGAGNCVSVPKTCPSNCSTLQGRCMFVNADTGAEVETCFVGATDCNAVCDCEEDFAGSETCSLNSTQLLQKQTLRAQVIQGIRDLVSLEDPDQDTVAGWVESVVSASQSPDELSQDGVNSLIDTVTTVLRSARRTSGVSVVMISRLMRSVDASVQASANAQRRRRRLQGRGVNELTTRLLQETAEALNSTLARTESILSIYRSFAADSLLVGQDSVSLVLPQFRVLVQKQSLVGMAAAGNVTVSAPSTALEGINGRAPNSVAVPVLGEQSSLSVSLTTMRSELYNTELYLNGADQVFSSPLSVELSDTACEGPGCRFEMVLQVASEIASFTAAKSSPLTHNTTCAAGDVSNHTHTCPDGNSVTARCPGFSSTVISRCPADSFAAVCNFVGGSGVADSGCIMVASTDTNVTCSCPLPQSRRKLQQSTNDDDAANNAEASVSYVAMLSQVKDNFEQTILSAQGLDASTVEDGFSAILTVGCIAAAVLFGLSWAHHADADAAKVKPKSESEKKKVAPTASKTGFMQSVRNLFTRKTSRNRAIAPATKWCVNKDVQIAEQALPAILSSTSLTHRVKDEIKNRHKWLGIVFFFSPSFPRVLRVISLATNVIIMLFIQSLTYALTNPDDGLCETYLSKPACLEPDSPYATGASKCYWTESTGECAVVQPDSSVKVILFVAIFSAIIATPLALVVDWLVFNVLSAPTRTAQNTVSGAGTSDTGDLSPNLAIVAGAGNISERRNSSRKRSSLTGTVRGSIFGNVIGADGNTIEHTATLSAQSDMSKLVQELTAYRATLSAEQKVEFDAIWGLDENGYFCSGDENVSYWSRAMSMCKSNQRSSASTSTNVAQHVLTDLKSVHTSLLTETARTTDVSLSDQEKGKRLLFLFQCDLLPGISGKILDSKGKRDNLTVRHVSFEAKVAVWTFLAAANVGMLFYILLFALSQTVHRQGAWALSFVMWLVVEVLFVSSATVLFTHVFIPSLIMQDVNKIKLKLVDSIRAFNKGVRSRNRGTGSQKGPEHFNAAEYLFVSTRLAAQSEWSELREAQIIALFRTPWPKQSYQRESDVSQTYSRKYAELYRSVSIVAIFFLTNLLQIPPAFQDMVIQMCTTAAVGYTVLLHIDLYDVFPALVIIPCLIIGLLVYALIRYNAKRAQRRLEKTFPMEDMEDEDKEEDVQAVELEKIGDYQNSDAVNGKNAAFQTELPASTGDAEDEVIARAALDLAQSGELHLPPPDTAAPQGQFRGGHTTRKQSVIAGLRVLNVLQETRGPTSTMSADVSESQDQSDSDTDYQAESKQGEHENVYSENLYSVDELYDSVEEQEESEVGIVIAHKPEVAGKQSAHLATSVSSYSMTPSEEEAMYGGFDGDSDVEGTYFSDVDSEGGEEETDGVEEDAKRDGEGGESDEGESGEKSEEESGEEEQEGDEEEGSGGESEGEDEGSDGDGEGIEAEY